MLSEKTLKFQMSINKCLKSLTSKNLKKKIKKSNLKSPKYSVWPQIRKQKLIWMKPKQSYFKPSKALSMFLIYTNFILMFKDATHFTQTGKEVTI